ncbi:MAG: SHOCT domain-containing protein, partial [Cyanobacteria bacterium J06641_2]
YLAQDEDTFDRNFNSGKTAKSVFKNNSSGIGELAEDLRKLDALREDGLISEYEFEQKRRQLIDSEE